MNSVVSITLLFTLVKNVLKVCTLQGKCINEVHSAINKNID